MMAGEMTEDFAAGLPRSRALDGTDLIIEKLEKDGSVLITDGHRSAHYEPMGGIKPLSGPLSIKASYVETGWFTEANVIKFSDGTRDALYVPRPVGLAARSLGPAPNPQGSSPAS